MKKNILIYLFGVAIFIIGIVSIWERQRFFEQSLRRTRQRAFLLAEQYYYYLALSSEGELEPFEFEYISQYD